VDSAVSEDEFQGGQHDLKLPVGLDAIVLRRNRFAYGDVSQYRIYTTPEDFIRVLANSAAEAMEKSNIDRPWKIQRELMECYPHLSEAEMTPTDEVVEMRSDHQDEGPMMLPPEVLQHLEEELHPDPFQEVGLLEAFSRQKEVLKEPEPAVQEAPVEAEPVTEDVAAEPPAEAEAAAPENVAAAAEEIVAEEPEVQADALSESEIEALLRKD
jgi:hypothetical protein